MGVETESADARQEYAAAYAAHYTEHNLPLALARYVELLAPRAYSQEATYARMQVQNIVSAVVPKHELLDERVELALARLASRTASDRHHH